MRLIDADALKKAIEPYRYAVCGFEGVLALIDNAPTIDEQLHAKWLLEGGYNDRWFCSRCLHITRLHENYCSTCGACMIEGDKDETN